MEQGIEVFMGMIQNGFTMDGIMSILRLLFIACLLKVLYTGVNRVSGSVMIRLFNKRIEPGAYLNRMTPDGKTFTVKVLKVGLFRVFLLHCGTGGLLDPTTNEFNAKERHYAYVYPENPGKFHEKTASDFGL